MENKVFGEEFVAGRASRDDVHEYIRKWNADKESSAKLHEYLGMTWEQYNVWADTSSLDKAFGLDPEPSG